MFADAVSSELIGRSPFQGIKLPPAKGKEKRVLSPAELHALADEVGDRWRCLIYLSGVLGLRFGEVAALTVGDLDFVRRRVSVTKAVSEVNGYLTIGEPKTTAGVRTIDMPEQLATELAAHIEKVGLAGQPEALLFADAVGGPIRRSNFHRRVLRPALERADIEGFTFHGLRHSAATQWVAAGIDLRTVQYWLGHSTSRLVLELYAHAVLDETRAAAQANGSIFWTAE
jgi:integrase